MDNKFNEFQSLHSLFNKNGFNLYLVGGTVRDILLNIPFTDMDLVTDATPNEMKSFIDGNYKFADYGVVKYKSNGVKFDIVTLRKEKKYRDYRHPNKITFVKSLKKDHLRRDFTINAMYMDNTYQVIDFENGIEDINKRIIKMVGNPYKRLKEDPLRILRAIRFSLTYHFDIDARLEKALIKSNKLLIKLSRDKIKEELRKFVNIEKEEILKILSKYSINNISDMLE